MDINFEADKLGFGKKSTKLTSTQISRNLRKTDSEALKSSTNLSEKLVRVKKFPAASPVLTPTCPVGLKSQS